MKQIETRLKVIEDRNKRVENDKAWEVSLTRRLSITLFTYITVLLYLMLIKNEKPFLNASVPSIGFLLSTLLMKNIKKIWQNKK